MEPVITIVKNINENIKHPQKLFEWYPPAKTLKLDNKNSEKTKGLNCPISINRIDKISILSPSFKITWRAYDICSILSLSFNGVASPSLLANLSEKFFKLLIVFVGFNSLILLMTNCKYC